MIMYPLPLYVPLAASEILNMPARPWPVVNSSPTNCLVGGAWTIGRSHEPLQHSNWRTWFNATFISLILRWYLLLAYADYLVHRVKADSLKGWVEMRLPVRNAEQLAMLWLPYNTDWVSQITIHVTSTMQVTTSPAKLQSDLHFAYSQLSVFTNNRYTVHTEIPYRFTDSYNHTSPLFTKTPHEGNQAIHFIHQAETCNYITIANQCG